MENIKFNLINVYSLQTNDFHCYMETCMFHWQHNDFKMRWMLATVYYSYSIFVVTIINSSQHYCINILINLSIIWLSIYNYLSMWLVTNHTIIIIIIS